ncbi:PAS domain S-box-containing protein [Arcticibacter pallidicorallinus]|uniref:histidine kinase n=2 Tax=Arcticibacter pallidicorallinus TaxID=1259464 RepID=A0A2T0U417_9SPHI|nr:PAS domain S-box-containing protein [Arcticibacter pallidicorallinus]
MSGKDSGICLCGPNPRFSATEQTISFLIWLLLMYMRAGLDVLDIIFARGEMADRTRAFDWSATSVGPITDWPLQLRTAVNLLLDSGFPMFIWWGKEKIQFYNDAYLKILGTDEKSKHPKALGQKGEECWQEIWPVISPLIEDVLKTGDAVFREDQFLPIYRKGVLDDVYWTFSYNPIRGEDGTPEGILVVCTETTKRNQQLKETEQQLPLLEKQKQLYDNITSGTPDLMYMFDLQYKFTYANRALLEMWGKSSEEAIGKGLRENGYEEWHAAMHEREIDQVVASKERVRGEVSFPHAVLGKRVYDYILAPVLDEVGEIVAVSGTTRDITEIRKAEAAIIESEARFRNMAEGSGILIALASETGEINYFNKAWSALTGIDTDELLGFGWCALVHPEDKDACLKLYMDSLEKRVPYTGEYRMLSKNGEYRWLLTSGSPRFEPDGSFTGYIGSSIDITERKQNEQRKNEFISMVSHELKTPLTSTISYVQVSQRKLSDNGDLTTAGMLDRAFRQLGKMKALINGFLNVSRLEAGKIYIDKKSVDLSALLKDVESNIVPEASTHTVVFAPVTETWVNIDRDKIEQVISNFISNAIKYSPPNTSIRIACESKNGFAYVSVKDDGIGINQEDQGKLFDRFYRVEGQDRKSISGFGIGLYICKEIIERHGGEIGVISVPGEGSLFWFTLPIER